VENGKLKKIPCITGPGRLNDYVPEPKFHEKREKDSG
jgi:hypothetical protein